MPQTHEQHSMHIQQAWDAKFLSANGIRYVEALVGKVPLKGVSSPRG